MKILKQYKTTPEQRAQAKRWRQENKDRYLQHLENWRIKNPDYRKNKSKCSAKPHKDRLSSDPLVHKILFRAKARAELKGWEFSITEDDIKIPDICPILKVPLKHVKGMPFRKDYTPSLDRIDNTKGYVQGNVIIVSARANALKSDASLEELKALYEFYNEFI